MISIIEFYKRGASEDVSSINLHQQLIKTKQMKTNIKYINTRALYDKKGTFMTSKKKHYTGITHNGLPMQCKSFKTQRGWSFVRTYQQNWFVST